jgi:hypothetical protein
MRRSRARADGTLSHKWWVCVPTAAASLTPPAPLPRPTAFQEHPLLGVPFFTVHPCGAGGRIASMLGTAAAGAAAAGGSAAGSATGEAAGIHGGAVEIAGTAAGKGEVWNLDEICTEEGGGVEGADGLVELLELESVRGGCGAGVGAGAGAGADAGAGAGAGRSAGGEQCASGEGALASSGTGPGYLLMWWALTGPVLGLQMPPDFFARASRGMK